MGYSSNRFIEMIEEEERLKRPCPKKGCEGYLVEQSFDGNIESASYDEYLAGIDREFICDECGFTRYEDVDVDKDCEDDFDIPSEYYANALDTLNSIQEISHNNLESSAKIEIPLDSTQKFLIKVLYGSTIATLEAYLGDAFKNKILTNKDLIKSFVTNYTLCKKDVKYTLLEIFEEQNSNTETFVTNKVKSLMNAIIFHKLTKVYELYKQILGVDLPSNWQDFLKPIKKRHDIFHRCGRDKEGNEIDINNEELNKLIMSVSDFIETLDQSINCV
ncbi:MAG: hypothetical protein PHU51_02590 [Candidatus Nanoarchaeia archaeon]|nr:hypothetical protein [Candidatus Nanoarchaeia archaeon]